MAWVWVTAAAYWPEVRASSRRDNKSVRPVKLGLWGKGMFETLSTMGWIDLTPSYLRSSLLLWRLKNQRTALQIARTAPQTAINVPMNVRMPVLSGDVRKISIFPANPSFNVLSLELPVALDPSSVVTSADTT